ncbi:hypothetical protein HPC37_07815 [Pasteurellaceae bacterium 20609_3]|uniref:hypothetical protein n=1 Tax=Spirabiliibacterium mucosae TaxID=28156 RepID=UPI001AACF27A|nr:hypothetical protein [Spirabiliibacterium mucosae]MBE2898701.1 hypothetical protein [Spirabiliibacterium mucosae]
MADSSKGYLSDGIIFSLKRQLSTLDKKNIRLENKNISLNSEIQNLKKELLFYKQEYSRFDAEKQQLLVRELKARDKVLSYENSMSFRLGYAIIFAFKNPGGLRHLIKTIFSLIGERKIKSSAKIGF